MLRFVQSGARRAAVAVFAALLTLVLVWTGTWGVASARNLAEAGQQADTAARGTFGSLPEGKPVNSQLSFELAEELGGEELEGADKTFAVCRDSDGAHVLSRARGIGEDTGPSTIRAWRVIAWLGARGPPVG